MTLLVSVIILITITAIKTRKNKITQRLKMSGALKAKGKRSLICNVRFLLLSTILNFVFLRYTSVFHRLSLNRVVINSFLPLFDFFFILLLFRLSLSILWYFLWLLITVSYLNFRWRRLCLKKHQKRTFYRTINPNVGKKNSAKLDKHEKKKKETKLKSS